MTTRRESLKVIAASGAVAAEAASLSATVAAAQQHQHEDATAAAKLYQPVFFTAAEYACIDAVTSRIIPSVAGSPGAKEAGVAQYIDETVDRTAKLQPVYRNAVKALVEQSFVKLSSARQNALLTKLDAEGGDFWRSVRRLTIDGYYSSKVGLKDLGYSGKSFLTEFAGCTHPEHQA